MHQEFNKPKKCRSISNFTFKEEQPAYLSNLTTRAQSRSKLSDMHKYSNNIMEVQRVKSELTNSVQIASNKQELEMQHLVNRLSQVQLDIKPKITSLESQHTFMQKKIDVLREQIQKASIDDFISIQKQYEDLNDKFDKFTNVDVNAKMNPLSDNLSQTNSKINSLSNEANSSIQDLHESLRNISDKINLLTNSQAKELSYGSLNELIPVINFLEIHMRQIKQFVLFLKSNSRNNMIANQQNKNEDLSNQIEAFNNKFDESIKNLDEYVKKNTSELQIKIAKLKEEKNQIDLNGKESEKIFDEQLQFYDKMQKRINKLEEDYKTRFTSLNQDFDSAVNTLQLNQANLQVQTNEPYNTTNEEDLSRSKALKNQIEDLIRKIDDSVNKSTNENRVSQQEASERELNIKSQIEGDGNTLNRLNAIEDQILMCINAVYEVNQKRAEMHKKGFNNVLIIKQIENLEKRLEKAEKRLKNIDGETPPSIPDLIHSEECILPPPRQVTNNLKKQANNRNLPTIPEKIFPDEIEKENEKENENENENEK